MSEMETQRGYGEPQVVQFSVFLDNRVGKLRELLKLFEGMDVHLAALSVVDSIDCAIVRCVLVPSDNARGLLKAGGMVASETELVVIELPDPDGLAAACEALITAELNIHYVYPLLVKPHSSSALALHVDEPTMAAIVLRRAGFVLFGEADLK